MFKDNFSPREIAEIAVSVEDNGIKLYAALEEKAAEDRVRKVWSYLKNQEARHKRIFEEMLENRDSRMILEVNEGEYGAYLKAIASTYIFTLPLMEEKIRHLFASDMEAVDFAISIEKESILIYSALKDCMFEDKQADIEGIIEEEKRHLMDLTLLKKYLQKGG